MKQGLAALLWLLALPALAHDSWLAVRPAAGGSTVLALGTGNRFPLAESGSAAASLGAAACVDRRGRRLALRGKRETPTALELRAPATGALACWTELKAHEVALDAKLVEVYFREIRPGDEVRAAWAQQLERGEAWRESYRKFARIELNARAASAAELRKLRMPAGLPLEILVEGDAPLRVGQPAEFRVLASGQPVTGLAVELVSERSAIGIWGQTDADGRVRYTLPFGGNWLVRGTLVEQDGEQWRSRFATLAFELP